MVVVARVPEYGYVVKEVWEISYEFLEPPLLKSGVRSLRISRVEAADLLPLLTTRLRIQVKGDEARYGNRAWWPRSVTETHDFTQQ